MSERPEKSRRERRPFGRWLPHAGRGFLVVSALSVSSRAERPRVVVSHVDTDARSRRLLAEVRSVDLEPVDVPARRDEHMSPSRIAARYGAVAVLLLRQRGGIAVSVTNPETREVIHEFTVPYAGKAPASVRAVEVLRGWLADLDVPGESVAAPGAKEEPTPEPAPALAKRSQDPEPEGELEPIAAPTPAPMLDRAPDSEGRTTDVARPLSLWLGGGAGAGASRGGLGGAPLGDVTGYLAFTRRWSAGAFVLLPLGPQAVALSEGEANVRCRVFGAALRATLFTVADVMSFDVGGGGGVAVVSADGHAASPALAGKSATATAGVGVVTVGAAFRAARWLRLRTDATFGIAAPRPVVSFDGRDVAAWGTGFAALTFGAEVDALGLGPRGTNE